jgi:hypothetical protein
MIEDKNKLSKCKVGTIVAFKTVEDNWYTGKIQMIKPPNTLYNKRDYYKFNIIVTLPIAPRWIEKDDETIFFHNQIKDIKLLENYNTYDTENIQNNENYLIELFDDDHFNINWEYFKEFVNTYNIYRDSFGDECTIEDMLYGLGVALDVKKYSYASGYKLFKKHLKQWLESKNKY